MRCRRIRDDVTRDTRETRVGCVGLHLARRRSFTFPLLNMTRVMSQLYCTSNLQHASHVASHASRDSLTHSVWVTHRSSGTTSAAAG